MQNTHNKLKKFEYQVDDLFKASIKWGRFVHSLRTRDLAFSDQWFKHLDQEMLCGFLHAFCDIQSRYGCNPPQDLPDMTFDEFETRLLIVLQHILGLWMSAPEARNDENLKRAVNSFWDDLETGYKKDSDGQDIQ